MIKLEFSDGAADFPDGTLGMQIVETHFKRSKEVLALKIGDDVFDLLSPISHGGIVKPLRFDDPEGADVLRHTSSHIMALAIKRLYPKAKITIGPAVEDGFYYDFDDLDLKEEDFAKVEDEMAKIIHEKLPLSKKQVSRDQALEMFKSEPYKQELIRDLPDGEKITTYTLAEFEDLCRGPHLPNTGYVSAIKLLKLAGAYWRGDSKKKMLTRVYGTSFPDKKMLKAFVDRLEEAKRRDHRKLGRELDWFSFHEYSPGSAFFYPKGTVIYSELLAFIRDEYSKRGYDEVLTPLLYDKALWETSGHWEHFKDDMFIISVDGREFALKPMNCPSHCLMYLNDLRSYRELPLRIADFAPLHRNELKGVLGGLTRVRKFSQDDAHIFCTIEQVESEISDLLQFASFVYKDVFGMDYRLVLSTMPEKALGSKDLWDKAEAALESALKSNKQTFTIGHGEGAFYGPKIDMKVKDSLGREWQCATIQLDFNLPERFNLEYEGKDGQRHRPVMIHRAILGSVERFIGVLVEHFAGKLPLWLSPVQVKILPISDRHHEYAATVLEKLRSSYIRAEIDSRSESAAKKVRDAQLEKANYILVVGDKEISDKSVNVRTRAGEVKGTVLLDDFISSCHQEISSKRIS